MACLVGSSANVIGREIAKQIGLDPAQINTIVLTLKAGAIAELAITRYPTLEEVSQLADIIQRYNLVPKDDKLT